MLDDRELVRLHGAWDPALEAYEVIDPNDGRTRYFRWTKPWIYVEAGSMAVVTFFWVGLAIIILTGIFGYPEGVAGDRRQQLQAALDDRYNAYVPDLPQSWASGEALTVDVQQGWDDPDYDAPEALVKGCSLRPGTTAADLYVKCPTGTGGWEELSAQGRSVALDRYAKELQNPHPPPADPVPQSPAEDYPANPYDYMDEDPWLDYPEPEQMYP